MPISRFRKKITTTLPARKKALLNQDAAEVALNLSRVWRHEPDAEVELEITDGKGKIHRMIFRPRNPEGISPERVHEIRTRGAAGRNDAIQEYIKARNEFERQVKRRKQFPIGLLRRLAAGPKANIRLLRLKRPKKK